MTWRRFSVLLRGLSPGSSSIAVASSRPRTFGPRPDVTVRGPEQTQRAFVALFGAAKPAE